MENIMRSTAQNPEMLLNAEIKALLILLLLKGGTPSSEIHTALRLAAGEVRGPDGQDRPSQQMPEPAGTMPRQRIYNNHLPPLKSYAA